VNVWHAHLSRMARSPRPRDSAAAPRGEVLTRLADVGRVAIVCGSAAFLAGGDGSAALKALLVMPAAFAPRLVRVHPVLDLVFVLALVAESLGRGVAGYYGDDAMSHIVLPLLSGPVLYVGLVRLGALPAGAAKPAPLAVATVTAATVLAVGAMWELVEWTADGAFGTNYSQGYSDTLTDLLNDAIAAAGSGALVAAWVRASAERPEIAPAIASPARVARSCRDTKAAIR
jgi:hypothetical protein